MIPNPVTIVLCMLLRCLQIWPQMTLAWPQWPHTTTNPSLPDMLMTPGTSHNNQSLADRHADDPGDDRDTLSTLQNEHLSQKKIKHQQQCDPVTAQHQELHPPHIPHIILSSFCPYRGWNSINLFTCIYFYITTTSISIIWKEHTCIQLIFI